jgi:hypothetical protein
MANDKFSTVLEKFCESTLLKWFYFSRVHYKEYRMFLVLTEAVSILRFAAEAHIQTKNTLGGVFGGRNGIGSGLPLSASLSLAPVTTVPSVHLVHLFI